MFKEFTKEVNGREITFRIKPMDVTLQMAFYEQYGKSYLETATIEELKALKDRVLENIEYKAVDGWEQVKAYGDGNIQLPNLTAKVGRELELEFVEQVIKPVF